MNIIFRKSNKLGSKIIRLFTKEEWSHVGVSFDENEVYHADSKGVHKITLEEFCKDSEFLIIDKIHNEEMINRANSKLGSKYDFGAILWLAIYLPLFRIGIKLPKTTINPKWFLCSEFVEYVIYGTITTSTPGELLNRQD